MTGGFVSGGPSYGVLERKDPTGHLRLMLALKRHGLAEVDLRGINLSEPPRAGDKSRRPVMLAAPPRPVPELEAPIPSDTVLAKLAAFCADDSRTVCVARPAWGCLWSLCPSSMPERGGTQLRPRDVKLAFLARRVRPMHISTGRFVRAR